MRSALPQEYDVSEAPEGAPVLSKRKLPIPQGRHDFVALRKKRDVSNTPTPTVNKRLRSVHPALHLPRMQPLVQRSHLPVDVLARPLNNPNYATARGEERHVSIEIRAGSRMVFAIDGLVLEVKATV